MKSRLLLWLIPAMMLLWGKNGYGQNFRPHYGVELTGAAIKMVGGEVDRSTIDQWAGIRFNYVFDPKFALCLIGAYGWVYPRDPNGSQFKAVGNYKTELLPLGLHFRYTAQLPGPLLPFVEFGGGMIIWDIRQLTGNVSTFTRGKSINGAKRHASLIGGVGLEAVLVHDFSVRFSFNYHRLLKGHEDTIGYGDDANNGIIAGQLGLVYYFGGFKDRDHDGIEDKNDLDPDHPEDFDSFQDKDGAPESDNDNDGIPDIRDKAPNKPEDFDGFQDEDGAPDPDNDSDGVLDASDKCPNQPEDRDGFEDFDGCPELDNDGDLIQDSLDQCPNWPEDYNGYLDEDGCPDEKPEPIQEPKSTASSAPIILKGVNFESGSAQLTPESYRTLEDVLKTLIENPSIIIEIRGHTDNSGSFATNMRLSEQRALAVKNYLVARGISSNRIRAVGYGPKQPIASNATAQGRAANRRIEFIRIDQPNP